MRERQRERGTERDRNADQISKQRKVNRESKKASYVSVREKLEWPEPDERTGRDCL